MKRRYAIPLLAAISLTFLYLVDRKVFMKHRVTRHYIWEHTGDERIRGDFIFPEYISHFQKDTMIFNYSHTKDTLILKWQYFDTMKILDSKTGKSGKYSMKGENWIDLLFD